MVQQLLLNWDDMSGVYKNIEEYIQVKNVKYGLGLKDLMQ